jgi:hypothetical protein
VKVPRIVVVARVSLRRDDVTDREGSLGERRLDATADLARIAIAPADVYAPLAP